MISAVVTTSSKVASGASGASDILSGLPLSVSSFWLKSIFMVAPL